MLIALLANPDSGSGEADEVERVLGSHGAEVARFGLDETDAALASKPGRIVVAGGDGSIGCGAAAAARGGVPLGVIAVGTANDFARALELPDDLEEACRLAARGTRTRSLELGRFGERPFVNVASAGLPPVAARKAHGLKTTLGPLAYLVGALRAGISAKPIRCRIEGDGESLFAGDAWQVTIACTGAFGGGSDVEANPHDGKLDVVVVEAGPRIRLIARGYGFRRGNIEAQGGVVTARCHEVRVSTDGTTGFNVDGEVSEAASASFSAEADAFELIVG